MDGILNIAGIVITFLVLKALIEGIYGLIKDKLDNHRKRG